MAPDIHLEPVRVAEFRAAGLSVELQPLPPTDIPRRCGLMSIAATTARSVSGWLWGWRRSRSRSTASSTTKSCARSTSGRRAATCR